MLDHLKNKMINNAQCHDGYSRTSRILFENLLVETDNYVENYP